MTTGHTPIPWFVFPTTAPPLRMGECLLSHQIWSDCRDGARVAFTESQNVGLIQAEANAALIVKAVNSHDALVAALERLVNCRNIPTNNWECIVAEYEQATEQAVAALAAAGEA